MAHHQQASSPHHHHSHSHCSSYSTHHQHFYAQSHTQTQQQSQLQEREQKYLLITNVSTLGSPTSSPTDIEREFDLRTAEKERYSWNLPYVIEDEDLCFDGMPLRVWHERASSVGSDESGGSGSGSGSGSGNVNGSGSGSMGAKEEERIDRVRYDDERGSEERPRGRRWKRD